MTTHSSPSGPVPGQEPDDAESQARDRPVRGTSSQASGRQFERGTRAAPEDVDSEAVDDAAASEPGSGQGSSASGKQFARGTDSDGDGHGYGEARRPST